MGNINRIRWLALLSLCILFFGQLSLVHAQEITVKPDITSPSAILTEAHNGQILYEEEARQTYPIGQLTKILSLCVLVDAIQAEEIHWQDTVVVSDAAYALSQDYNLANVPLRQDVEYTVEELVEAVAMVSANGAMLALCEHLTGSEEAFVQLMQTQLAEWGYDFEEVYNATGLAPESESQPVNQLSAESLATAAYHLITSYPEILAVTSQEQSVFQAGTSDAFDMMNMNDMLPSGSQPYSGMEGLAVSQADESRINFVAVATKGNLTLLAVLLNTDETEIYTNMRRFLDYGFANYMLDDVAQAGAPVRQVAQVDVHEGRQPSVQLLFQEDLSIVVPLVDIAPRLIYELTLNEQYLVDDQCLEAPLPKGQTVGYVTVTGTEQKPTYLPQAQGNRVAVITAKEVAQAPWYMRTWRVISYRVQDTWRNIRRVAIQWFN